eukprot:scaffold7510_cov46-Attheya_sp.AAC.2
MECITVHVIRHSTAVIAYCRNDCVGMRGRYHPYFIPLIYNDNLLHQFNQICPSCVDRMAHCTRMGARIAKSQGASVRNLR